MSGTDRDYLVELATLGNCIMDYSEIGSGLTELLSLCRDAARELSETGWKGEAEESFTKDFDTWTKDVEDFKENINELGNALKAMYKSVSELKDDGGKLSNYL